MVSWYLKIIYLAISLSQNVPVPYDEYYTHTEDTFDVISVTNIYGFNPERDGCDFDSIDQVRIEFWRKDVFGELKLWNTKIKYIENNYGVECVINGMFSGHNDDASNMPFFTPCNEFGKPQWVFRWEDKYLRRDYYDKEGCYLSTLFEEGSRKAYTNKLILRKFDLTTTNEIKELMDGEVKRMGWAANQNMQFSTLPDRTIERK